MNVFRLSNFWMQVQSIATLLLPDPKVAIMHRRDRGDTISMGPYSLVQFAYRGGLVRQGVPSQLALLKAHRHGQISASLLVKHAFQAGLVSVTDVRNPAYFDAVETGFLFHYLLHPQQ